MLTFIHHLLGVKYCGSGLCVDYLNCYTVLCCTKSLAHGQYLIHVSNDKDNDDIIKVRRASLHCPWQHVCVITLPFPMPGNHPSLPCPPWVPFLLATSYLEAHCSGGKDGHIQGLWESWVCPSRWPGFCLLVTFKLLLASSVSPSSECDQDTVNHLLYFSTVGRKSL